MDEDDLKEGIKQFSREMVENINFEMQDVVPNAVDILYSLVESELVLHENDVLFKLMELALPDDDAKRILDLLLYYAVFGIEESDQVRYIYVLVMIVKKCVLLRIIEERLVYDLL